MPLTHLITDPADPIRTYDRLALHLAISPLWQDRAVGGACSLLAIPYRVMPDGTIERRDDLARSLVTADLFAQAEIDPAFGAAVQTIWDAIQTYLDTAGI